jgi:cytidylate kinase
MRGGHPYLSSKAEPIVICICGMAGTGKSTLAKRLAERYGLKYYSGGDAMRDLAVAEGYDAYKPGWWESPEGLKFIETRAEDSRFDKAVDAKLLEYAAQGNVVIDSWTMPWLFGAGYKIWLEASVQKRAERIAKRDRISVEEALEALKKKEARTREIYRKLYGFTLGEDFSPFHLILDTDNLTAEEVFRILCSVVDNVILKNHQHCKNSIE